MARAVLSRLLVATGLLVVTLLSYGVMASAWGSWSGLLANPARRGALVAGLVMTLVAAFSPVNLSSGRRADLSDLWIMPVGLVLAVLMLWLLPFLDRRDRWVIDGDAVRWLGLALLVAGGALRVWPMFVLGHRFSGLVAIQEGHRLVTDGVYRWIRNPSYLGYLVASVGWALVFRCLDPDSRRGGEIIVPEAPMGAAPRRRRRDARLCPHHRTCRELPHRSARRSRTRAVAVRGSSSGNRYRATTNASDRKLLTRPEDRAIQMGVTPRADRRGTADLGQLALGLSARGGWGGRRAGAGRKPGARPPVPHRPRGELAARHPAHVTVRLRPGLPSLRSVRLVREIERSFRASCDRGDFRLVHYTLLSNHAHLVVEAANAHALARGMKAVGARLARAVHRVCGVRGPVLAERFHLRVLRTPLEVRRALAYVLLNARRHSTGTGRAVAIDPASSGRWFNGWRRLVGGEHRGADAPVARPLTWLLRYGWRRHGLLDPDERPGRRARGR